MRKLYHFPLDPACRKVRLLLAEKKLEADEVIEKSWERRSDLLRLSPAGDLPVMIESDGTSLVGGRVIAEYLEEVYPEPNLLGQGRELRAEVRRLSEWFDEKFYFEVTLNLLGEKAIKRLSGSGQPSSGAIRAGHGNIRYHLDYIAWLCDRRAWLAGSDFSRADIAAAAQLSCIDYLGDVRWDDHPGAKDWYARIKSRPSFRSILADKVSGLGPSADYANLDF